MAATSRMFTADWCEALFVHFCADPGDLQPLIPFPLDVFNGAAYVSLVAFTQKRLRFARGGRLTAWLAAPLARHEFLNLRTYVRVCDEPGIHFLAEWIPNRLAAFMGPRTYGLPYRLGRLTYHHDELSRAHACVVTAASRSVRLHAETGESSVLSPCSPGSLDAFLLERYSAFTFLNGTARRFRVEHAPWPQQRARIRSLEIDLIRSVLPWLKNEHLAGANYSAGANDVTISAPTILNRQTAVAPRRNADAFRDTRRE